MKIIFTFTIRLLTHVTSEETSYPTKSMTSALEFFRYAARVGISILLEPQEAFQPVNFPLCKEFMCTPLSHNLCFLLFLSYEGTRGLSTVFLDLFLHHTLVPRKQIIDTRHHDQCQQCSI